MDNWQLIIFDMDSTLSDRETGDLLPGVADYFATFTVETAPKFALATNQGGVGLRYWMEKGRFGKPGKFPDEPQIREHIEMVMNNLHTASKWDVPFNINVCFAYRNKQGKISPTPPGYETLPEWNIANRKPGSGMLTDAMAFYGIDANNTLMVGDRPEDKKASENAGCAFMWAWDFFGRDEPEEVRERIAQIKKRAIEFAFQLSVIAKEGKDSAGVYKLFTKASNQDIASLDASELETLQNAIAKHAKKNKYLPEYEVEADLYLTQMISAVNDLNTDT